MRAVIPSISISLPASLPPPVCLFPTKIMMASAAAATNAEEPILSRLDRIDNILRQLEDMRGHKFRWSPKSSSCASSSTPSSGTLTTSDDGGAASFDFSPPRSLEKHCRPLNDVITDTEHKGSLVERLVFVEDKLLKLCLRLEEELEAEKKRREKKPPNSKKGLKQLVRSCVKPRTENLGQG